MKSKKLLLALMACGLATSALAQAGKDNLATLKQMKVSGVDLNIPPVPQEGKNADYIPILTETPSDLFGVVIVTKDGKVYSAGDVDYVFSIQSVSKPFVYGIALEDNGRARVEQAIGMEPTGDPFNAISLEPGTGRPLTPMINAGASAASQRATSVTPESELVVAPAGYHFTACTKPLALASAMSAGEVRSVR